MENLDYSLCSSLLNDKNFEDDDLFVFQLDSRTINIYYSQLAKYSKIIRDGYLFSDVKSRLPQEINQLQNQNEISSDVFYLFFQLIQNNYNIDENSTLTYIQCIDLIEISKHYQIRKLLFQISEYIKRKNFDVDFIIQMIQYETEKRAKTEKSEIEINSEVEIFLANKIDDCFTNEKFAELPISIIYRVIEQSMTNSATSDKIFDFIKKSLGKFFVLFQFVELEKLSESKLEEMCEIYSNSDEQSRKCFNYIKCDINLIKKMLLSKRSIQRENKSSETKISQLQNQVDNSERIMKEQQDEMEQFKSQIEQLKKQLSSSEALVIQIKDEMQKKLDETEKEKNELRKSLDEINSIEGHVSANVKNGLLISAKISLALKGESLDTERSKYIISSNDSEKLGAEAYVKGEPITSPKMNTIDFLCKPGTYCVRCIVFTSSGKVIELVSNCVTTSGSSIAFGYEGRPAKFSLCKGKYKLEVWGAKGGDSGGTRQNSEIAKGGLGGYSRGVLNLDENEIVYVYVGGEGRPASSSEGDTADGGFPDGGGTKTGHAPHSYTSAPGTGGGSTSIRIKEDGNYYRVIVAGGGGGASGSSHRTNNGGFGGGLSGGNCQYEGSLKKMGSGTQNGSSGCIGGSINGESGMFGHGATGRYDSERDSGGGGGGGWYGGGGGGSGFCTGPSSGGGGSGWIFTASNFSTWNSGDATEASKFALNSSFYLSDALTAGGNEEFPRQNGMGIERGHSGNGYAKITPL